MPSVTSLPTPAANRALRRAGLLLGAWLALAGTAAAEDPPRFYRHLAGPGGKPVVALAEGDHEPRSAGSYSLRVYSGTAPDFPFDDFVAGVVRSRDGTLRDLRLADVDGDGRPEIVVIMQAAGSGGHLSAEAWTLAGRSLKLRGEVRGLPPRSDVIASLSQAIRDAALPKPPATKASARAPAPRKARAPARPATANPADAAASAAGPASAASER